MHLKPFNMTYDYGTWLKNPPLTSEYDLGYGDLLSTMIMHFGRDILKTVAETFLGCEKEYQFSKSTVFSGVKNQRIFSPKDEHLSQIKILKRKKVRVEIVESALSSFPCLTWKSFEDKSNKQFY